MRSLLFILLLLVLTAGCTKPAGDQELDTESETPAVIAADPSSTPIFTPPPSPSMTMTATAFATTTPAATATAAPSPTSEAAEPALIAPLDGLLVRVAEEGVFQVREDGRLSQILDEETVAIPSLRLAPDGRQAAYLDDERQLWLLDTASGERKQLAAGHNLSYFLSWGNEDTLLAGVWLDPEEMEGPNNGHLTLIDLEGDTLSILDEDNLFGNRPAMLSGEHRVAFDSNPATSGRLFDPDNGLQRFDPAAFEAQNKMIQGKLFNPAWSPGGAKIAWLTSTGERVALQVFDLQAQTAVQIHDWDPARFGGMVPSPVWSPDGRRLAVQVMANGPEGSGVWLLAAGGGEPILIDALGFNPVWTGDSQLLFNREGGPRLYDPASGEQFLLDLPRESTIPGQ